ncbi:MAG: Crp/Fnr family transcriptional regulator [Alphaproteobacteria bacterium]|nr:Crp/Fnr family transcriptional regulator [Alphaproteobacteria bacterium]
MKSDRKNALLAAMPAEDAAFIAAQCAAVDLPLRLTLQTPDMPITHCWFVETGIVSIVAVLSDGEPLETGLVGYEGVVGLPALLGAGRSPAEALVQLPGSGLRIEVDALKSAFDSRVGVREVLLRYVQAMQVQVSQTAACNGRHDTEQRLARWLLMADDKYRARPMPLTQEFLSMMLGVRRQQVSIAAAILQKAGYIQYRHGSIEILDRPGLENAACECYGVVAREFTRLLG